MNSRNSNPINFSRLAEGAASKGHLDVVIAMTKTTSMTSEDYDYIAIAAAEGGHLDIVKLMIEYGSDNLKEILIAAKYNGCRDIIDYILDTMRAKIYRECGID